MAHAHGVHHNSTVNVHSVHCLSDPSPTNDDNVHSVTSTSRTQPRRTAPSDPRTESSPTNDVKIHSACRLTDSRTSCSDGQLRVVRADREPHAKRCTQRIAWQTSGAAPSDPNSSTNKSREQHRHVEHSIGNPLKITRANGEQNHKLSVPTWQAQRTAPCDPSRTTNNGRDHPAGHSSEWFKWRSANEWQRK